MRFLTALTTSLICLQTMAHAGEKKSALDAYVQRVGAIVNGLIDSEITKHPERLNPSGFSVKLRYHVGRNGRVQAIEIISAKPDRSAADRIAYLIRITAFPPYPQDVLQQGLDSIAGELDCKWVPDKPEESPYYRYNMQVHKILQRDVGPALSSSSQRLEVDYEFYLDGQGRVLTYKTHAKAGGHSAEEIIVHSIRKLKFPPVPVQVFKELAKRPPLKIFGTMTWDPQ